MSAGVYLQPTQLWLPGSYAGAPPVQTYLCNYGCLVAQSALVEHQQGAHP